LSNDQLNFYRCLHTLQENLDLVAVIFPHKMLISAKKCKFPGGIDLPVKRMPVNFLAEISANNF
jgi:hypothetical protein